MTRAPQQPYPRSSGNRGLRALLQFVTAVAVLAAVGVVVWKKEVQTTKESPTAAIRRLSGKPVSCTDVGVMALSTGQSKVLLCTDASTGYRACWADLGNAVEDVTSEIHTKYFGADAKGC